MSCCTLSVICIPLYSVTNGKVLLFVFKLIRMPLLQIEAEYVIARTDRCRMVRIAESANQYRTAVLLQSQCS